MFQRAGKGAKVQSAKEKQIWWAGMIWLASGIYLFAKTPGAEFLSKAAAIYFLPGLFAATLFIGGGSYLLLLGLATVLRQTLGTKAPGFFLGQTVSFLGLALWIGETVLIFVLARWTVEALV